MLPTTSVPNIAAELTPTKCGGYLDKFQNRVYVVLHYNYTCVVGFTIRYLPITIYSSYGNTDCGTENRKDH